MRNVFSYRAALAAVIVSAFLPVYSCSRGADSQSESEGYIRLSFPEDMYKAALEKTDLPDTNDFILDIRNSSGESVYSGLFGDSPETLTVPPGSYTVSVRSSEFEKPRFSSPQYGDEQCVLVPSEGVVNVRLECRQINSGIRLKISPDFLTAYPDGVLFVSSADGRLMYGYTERRIAYFRPGSVSVVLSDGGKENVLMTRSLSGQEILTVNVSVSDPSPGEDLDGAISVSIDTTRIWNEEDIVIGDTGQDKGDDPDNAMSVAQARSSVGAEDVWVYGYIVGGDLSRTSMSFSAPFSSDTNLALAVRSSVSSKESCISVSLPSGEIRDVLNLVDHPDNLGRRVSIKGDVVESYFGIVGLKNVTGYRMK